MPLTAELLQMKVEPLNPSVDMFSTLKHHVSPSVFEKLVDNKQSSHHRSTKHLYQVNDHYDDPRSSTSFRNEVRDPPGSQLRSKPKRPQSMRKHTRAMSEYFNGGPPNYLENESQGQHPDIVSPFNQKKPKNKRLKKPAPFGFEQPEEVFLGQPGPAVGKDSQSNSSNHDFLLSPTGQFGFDAYKPTGFSSSQNPVRAKRNMRKSYDTSFQRPRFQNRKGQFSNGSSIEHQNSIEREERGVSGPKNMSVGLKDKRRFQPQHKLKKQTERLEKETYGAQYASPLSGNTMKPQTSKQSIRYHLSMAGQQALDEPVLHKTMINTTKGVQELKAMARTRFKRDGEVKKQMVDYQRERVLSNSGKKAAKPRLTSAHATAGGRKLQGAGSSQVYIQLSKEQAAQLAQQVSNAKNSEDITLFMKFKQGEKAA